MSKAKCVDEELVAYLCLQKIMQVYDDDHFEPEEKIAQLLSDSMNVVPGLHHTVSKRLGRFINLRGQDSIRARTKFRKDMRKLLASNLACPDYLTFLLERLWHSRLSILIPLLFIYQTKNDVLFTSALHKVMKMRIVLFICSYVFMFGLMKPLES